jgi:hypothetical protein
MEIPNTGTAIIIIVAFLLPGFVTVMMQERTFKRGEDRSDLDRLMRIFLYSGFTYALLALLAMLAKLHRAGIVNYFDGHRDNPALLVFIASVLVLFPSTLVWWLTKWWVTSDAREVFFEQLGMNPRHAEAMAWDYFVRKRKSALVRVTYPTGARVLGYYGGDSFAAYGRDGGDLYLEKAWTMTDDGNDWFDAEALGTLGVWIRPTDAVSVEFYTAHHEWKPRQASSEQADGSGTQDPERPPSAEGQPDAEGHPAASSEQEAG